MPVFDLDEALSNLLPFDFKIRLGGVEYATRAPSLYDLALLANFKTLSPEQAKGAIGNFFVGPDKPDVTKLEPMQLAGVSTAIGEAFRVHVEKNSKALAAQVRAALGQATAGSTSGK